LYGFAQFADGKDLGLAQLWPGRFSEGGRRIRSKLGG
jgi:hypothetical protein